MANYYGHSNPNMKYGVEMQDPNIPMSQSNIVVQRTQRWSWCTPVWSSIVLFLCCPLFGFIGLMCSVFSYVDHKSGDFDRSDRKRKCSWGWSMSGLVLGLLGIIGLIVIYALFWSSLVAAANNNSFY